MLDPIGSYLPSECLKFAISNAASKLTNTGNFQRNDSNFLSFPISKHPGEIISKQKERREGRERLKIKKKRSTTLKDEITTPYHNWRPFELCSSFDEEKTNFFIY
jgi:hypothetical protein